MTCAYPRTRIAGESLLSQIHCARCFSVSSRPKTKVELGLAVRVMTFRTFPRASGSHLLLGQVSLTCTEPP